MKIQIPIHKYTRWTTTVEIPDELIADSGFEVVDRENGEDTDYGALWEFVTGYATKDGVELKDDLEMSPPVKAEEYPWAIDEATDDEDLKILGW